MPPHSEDAAIFHPRLAESHHRLDQVANTAL
jgi:hypothetical protein